MISPGAVNNSFGRHFVLWVFFLPFISIIVSPLLMDDSGISKTEYQMVQSLGVNSAEVTATTNRVFSNWFIKTRVVSWTEELFGEKAKREDKAKSVFSRAQVEISTGYIENFWAMIYKVIWRWRMLLEVLIIPFCILAVAAMVDGVVQRIKKRYTFSNANPVLFYGSTHLVIAIIGMSVFLPVLPFELSKELLGLFLVGATAGIWITSSNLQIGK